MPSHEAWRRLIRLLRLPPVTAAQSASGVDQCIGAWGQGEGREIGHMTIAMGERPSETILVDPPEPARARLEDALRAPGDRRREAVGDVVRAFPHWSEAWARLGQLARDDLEAYACYRVGYHRGLDALRHAGWRGSGYVRWVHEENRGFLRCVEGLRVCAEAIGEGDEAQRCFDFLRQLDPAWPPLDVWGR